MSEVGEKQSQGDPREARVPEDPGPPAEPLVAVVDDEDRVREVLCRAFERAGIVAAACAGAGDALRLVRSCRPDVFLVDMTMPETTGDQLCRQLRANPGLERSIVVLMTGMVQGRDQSEAVVAGLEAGANDYLFKPLDLDETVARIRAWLRVKRSRDELATSALRAEESLRREQAYNRAVLASMADAVLVVAEDGTVRSCNPRALAMLGLGQKELIGSRVGGLFVPGSELAGDGLKRMAGTLRSGEIRDLDSVAMRSDGSAVPVSVSCALLAAEGASGAEVVLVARDITERKHHQEEERQRAQQMADQAQRALDYAQVVLRTAGPQGELVGCSAAHRRVVEFVREAADAPSAVLVLGESGTGKEMVSRAIHANGVRAGKPFVVVDCSALSATLLESELFGHEKGAFTGAASARSGLVEVADGGTLFVDEIGELPLELQPKLLRVLEGGEYRRLGSSQPRRSDVRVVAATNRDLAAEVRKGRFRKDLYYRLNVLCVTLPPLRERLDDVPVLARHFVKNTRVTAAGEKDFRHDALKCMEAYDWPGNVRELANVVERAVILSKSQRQIGPQHLPPEVRKAAKSPAPRVRVRSLADVEKEAIALALEAAGWNKTRAAEKLGIARVTLREKIAHYGLSRSPRDIGEPGSDPDSD